MHDHGSASAHDHAQAFRSPEMADFAELEGEVLRDLAAQAVERLAHQCQVDGVTVRRVLDLGSGPGVGTGLLAQRFTEAQVVAADGSEAMLDRAATRVAALGLSARVQTRTVDLSAPLEELGRADVVWMSMALHHLGDETGVLRRVRALLESNGLLVLVEQAGAVQVLPVDAERERPGIGERLDAAWASWFDRMRSTLASRRVPTDHATSLRAAGYELVDHEMLRLSLDAPLDERARRFAHRQLAGTQRQLGPHADPADLAYLDTLTDGDGDAAALRDDLTLQTARHLFLARPAAAG